MSTIRPCGGAHDPGRLPFKRQSLWDTMAQAEPRLKAIEFWLVATAADLPGDRELQPANLDGRAGILPMMPRLATLGFQGDFQATAASKALPSILPAPHRAPAKQSPEPAVGSAKRAREPTEFGYRLCVRAGVISLLFGVTLRIFRR
jgi:hypothetical protein